MVSDGPDWGFAVFEADVGRLTVGMACDCDAEDSQQVEAAVDDSVPLVVVASVGMAEEAAAYAAAGMDTVEETEVGVAAGAAVAVDTLVTERVRQLRLLPDSRF